jgi:hypothetical protein
MYVLSIRIGWYEALIANRGWNFSAVYVGRAGMVELLAAMIEQRQDFLYSWCVRVCMLILLLLLSPKTTETLQAPPMPSTV